MRAPLAQALRLAGALSGGYVVKLPIDPHSLSMCALAIALGRQPSACPNRSVSAVSHLATSTDNSKVVNDNYSVQKMIYTVKR